MGTYQTTLLSPAKSVHELTEKTFDTYILFISQIHRTAMEINKFLIIWIEKPLTIFNIHQETIWGW